MGIFGRILDKLGIGDEPDAPTTPSPRPDMERPGHRRAPAATRTGTRSTTTRAAPPRPRAVPLVDVVSQLEQRAAANPQQLNWKTSIVDLLKLLDVDSSLTARKELAAELGCPPELMNDSAKMNMWLHKAVLGRIAVNGGNVPRELLD